ncbi:MAG TPA: nicotinate-nucleotide adenylyltransferase [Gordonia sp. (in: high G+C Gram-positive bacteria)]|uniref:nicotinate-nucleotide adenylyltransferase n=2 Tax=Gordonia TaxID=2053 RepID=UPI0025C607BE|nr:MULTISPECIES: nicotinate-nucleotide adenylyltransferase [unclassified Gordonia (in: high G+C Gram-positive bacteria)]HNP58712.1 nicotinate-nucleotide adenylyltransferase [Gordonia sp. (in: high G+C Gram-positive bacteria)]HRC52424.1 nicotinate-nucleotide adenylyltransferase [Gordonia sp. (in: high G+C Gram-positive bacteria)]
MSADGRGAKRTAAGSGASGATRKRRIGVMGGTFDPIHNGHLVAGSEVAHRFGLDEVMFVPTGQPWQKTGQQAGTARDVSPAEDRYLMTVIATASNPQFSVSRVDIDREGNTYTVDTLRDLNRQLPDAELYFITGADALESILSWQDFDELFSLARFIGVSRPGYELSASHLAKHLRELPPDTLQMLEIPALAISSTECRARAAAGKPVWYLVPDGVVQYIAKRGLYRRWPHPGPTVSAPG